MYNIAKVEIMNTETMNAEKHGLGVALRINHGTISHVTSQSCKRSHVLSHEASDIQSTLDFDVTHSKLLLTRTPLTLSWRSLSSGLHQTALGSSEA